MINDNDNILVDYSNWIFFAEGGKHILCRDKRYSKYLLRLRKIDINDNYNDNDNIIDNIDLDNESNIKHIKEAYIIY